MSATLRNRQAGFSIVAAVFILVVLSALAGFVVTVSTTQHAGAALDVQGARAYQAARAGAEWGAYAVLPRPNQTAPALPAFETLCAGSNYASPSATQYLTIDGFGVRVRCGSAQFTDGTATPFRVYRIEATACSPASGTCPNVNAVGSLPYVERRVSITVTNSP